MTKQEMRKVALGAARMAGFTLFGVVLMLVLCTVVATVIAVAVVVPILF